LVAMDFTRRVLAQSLPQRERVSLDSTNPMEVCDEKVSLIDGNLR